MKAHDATTSADPLALLEAHGTYMSPADEAEIIDRALVVEDVGWLALRTCMCGARIEGFDEYTNHLIEVFRAAQGQPGVADAEGR